MTKRMLIDSTHAEETRVVVLDGSRLEDFDVETSTKKQLKGNIYLAKVVRVEPSLQAAFVEYGGNRHGFLAFGEIHPDYYQIPVADRQRLLAMEAEDARREEEEEDREALAEGRRESGHDESGHIETGHDEGGPDEGGPDEGGTTQFTGDEGEGDEPGYVETRDADAGGRPEGDARGDGEGPSARLGEITEDHAPDSLEAAAGESAARASTGARSQPARIASDSVSAALDKLTPSEEGDAFRVSAAATGPEPAADAAMPELVATFVAPAAASLPDGGDHGVQINAGQVEAGHAATMEIDAPSIADGGAGADDAGDAGTIEADSAVADEASEAAQDAVYRDAGYEDADSEAIPDAPPPETVGGDTENGEDSRERRIPPRFLRNYKIQEVIRRRQILLVQVVKEERGTKGAALTTYISLAGRYCVLMPNSPRGGGISRKITSATDRRRLKEVTAELEIPNGMGLIVRTAGANRPKPEIKRDCEYLMRLWDDIREHTMKSVAPALIYEEASLIKRSIRDVYSRDIDEILVDGEEGWKSARDFMRMLMPSHVKKVQLWRDTQPLFARQQVEAQLDAMMSPTVQLRSGGYLVINQTEALVAIDVNSGRSTRERGIEETAVRTNLEAVDEVARQLRLRDLAGLIVIDLIDMESRKNNASVERRLKEALKNDRARIQVGHISHFGLMEMSRQRLRPSLAETSFVTCPHCGGIGHVRGTESSAIHVLRDIEEEGAKRRAAEILVRVAPPIAMYVLNHKRQRLGEIEARYSMHVAFVGDDTLIPPQIRIDRVRPQVLSDLPAAITPDARAEPASPIDTAAEVEDDLPDEDDDIEGASETGRSEVGRSEVGRPDAGQLEAGAVAGETAEEGERRRRRRRRRRGGRRDEGAPGSVAPVSGTAPDVAQDAGVAVELDAADLDEHIEGVPEHAEIAADGGAQDAGGPDAGAGADAGGGDDAARGRRRGRRGGRRRRRDGTEGGVESVAEPGAEQPDLSPLYTGPTPANPFGGQVFDIFDVLEQAEQAGDRTGDRPAQALAASAPDTVRDAAVISESPPETPPALARELVVEPNAPVVTPSIASEAVPAPDAAVATEAVVPVPANDPAPEPLVNPPEPLVKPIVIGAEEDAAVEKKRGWWRR